MSVCHRAIGRSIRDCERCRIPPWDRETGGGWRPCPPARTFKRQQRQHNRHLTAAERQVLDKALRRSAPIIDQPAPLPAFSGDICADCGSPTMVRTGTCLTCQACGSSSGGCS